MSNKTFIDGTPIPDDYLERVSDTFKEALKAVENMSGEQLDEFEREIEHQRQRKNAFSRVKAEKIWENIRCSFCDKGGNNGKTIH